MPSNSVDNSIIAENNIHNVGESTPALDYYSWMKQAGKSRIERDTGPWSRLINWISGSDKKNRAEYEAYLTNLENENEWKATQSARQYEEYMANTQVQRLMRDYEKAGLNPYLLLNSGSVGTASVPTSAKSDYKRNKVEKDSGNAKSMALLLLALARLVAK